MLKHVYYLNYLAALAALGRASAFGFALGVCLLVPALLFGVWSLGQTALAVLGRASVAGLVYIAG